MACDPSDRLSRCSKSWNYTCNENINQISNMLHSLQMSTSNLQILITRVTIIVPHSRIQNNYEWKEKKRQQALGMWSWSLHPITYNLFITSLPKTKDHYANGNNTTNKLLHGAWWYHDTIKICTPSCRRDKSIVWLLHNDQDVIHSLTYF